MTLENRKQKTEIGLSDPRPPTSVFRGYTLIELMVAVSIFAMVMMLSSGAYLLMIDLNRQAQGTTTGIDSLSFALESMTRSIRTGSSYNCGDTGGDCSGAGSFSFKDASGMDVTYERGLQGAPAIGDILKNGTIILTDPSVNITVLKFYVSGTGTIASGDYEQPHVTIVVSGTVSSGPRQTPRTFTIETGATMRGVDLTATASPPVNGQCFTTLYACVAGISINNGSNASSWTWTCAGLNGGIPASCSKLK